MSKMEPQNKHVLNVLTVVWIYLKLNHEVTVHMQIKLGLNFWIETFNELWASFKSVIRKTFLSISLWSLKIENYMIFM